ncbi:MAG: hypothetical protein R6W77_10370 [Trueperaceae bacterium]
MRGVRQWFRGAARGRARVGRACVGRACVGRALVFVALPSFGAALAQPALTFQLVGPTYETERVTGIYCSAATACVVATDGTSDVGHVYASDGTSITATLLSGDYAFAETFDTLGTVDFFGFSKVGDTLIVKLDSAANAWVTATGDVTQASSWTASTQGIPDGASGFGGNQQLGWGAKDGRWVFVRSGTFFESTDAPGPGALWFPLWSPTPPGEVPSDLSALLRDDPRLCIADPGIGISPKLTQMAYVAPDLAVIVYPAGARNQRGSVEPGVCISVDGGQRFHHVPFPEVTGDLGPLGVTCASAEHCLAYGGLENDPESVYAYVTHDAQKGPDSTWTRATLPSLRENSRFRAAAFAQDGVTGWLVGATGSSSPLVLTTADGGTTWTDATSLVRGLAPDARLHSVFVVDAEHVWIGGEGGVVMAAGY